MGIPGIPRALQVDRCVEMSHLPASQASGVKDKAIWSPFDSLNCNYTIWPRDCWQPLFEAAVPDRDRAVPRKPALWNSSLLISLPPQTDLCRSLVPIVNLAEAAWPQWPLSRNTCWPRSPGQEDGASPAEFQHGIWKCLKEDLPRSG